MTNKTISWLRTVIPGLWSALVAYLATLGLPQPIVDALDGPGEQAVVAVTLAAVYAGMRWLEPRMPRWLVRALMGSERRPEYNQYQKEMKDSVRNGDLIVLSEKENVDKGE